MWIIYSRLFISKFPYVYLFILLFFIDFAVKGGKLALSTIYEQWNIVLSHLEEKISKPNFDAWFARLHVCVLKDKTLTFTVPNQLVYDFLVNQPKYSSLIADLFYDLRGELLTIKFILPENADGFGVEVAASTETLEKPSITELVENKLNPKYVFDSFVVGSGNRFAHAASLAVATTDMPVSYNPLFIYGGVGLGKTHLMHAIGNYAIENEPLTKVVYLSSEKFTNEFIVAIQHKTTDHFRNKYRNVDFLLIDDIQFLAGKEQTLEEFFHTFNTLHDEKKQIVISSDRQPKEIPELHDRLRSRFGMGLIIDINPPDLETRIAILRKKVNTEKLDIPNDVLVYIAKQINTNIRELEGALTSVIAHASFRNEETTVELASEVLKNIVPNSTLKITTILDIQRVVGEHFGIKLADFTAKKRTQHIAFPRQIAMYLSRDLTPASLLKIGEEFGGRDHTTVIHACDKITNLLKSDQQLQRHMKEIHEKLGM